jgi:hypothetical protein
MTTDTVLDAEPMVSVKAKDVAWNQRIFTAARDLTRAVRAAGTCPGTLTPLVEALSLALGDGPLWGPAPVDTEAPRQS